MLGFEVLQILQVLLVAGRLLVRSHVPCVLFLGCLSLTFIRLLFGLGQALPVLADQLGYLSECQVLAL